MDIDIQELTQHPELLNNETLYGLREMTAQYPYFQPARLLLLKNLYIMHDPSFDRELRQSAIFFTDRSVLFNLIEASHYRLKKKTKQSFSNTIRDEKAASHDDARTVSIIDEYLNTMPEDGGEKSEEEPKPHKHRKPTPADATVDYMAYLLATDFEELDNMGSEPTPDDTRTVSLIDNFINKESGRITLKEEPQFLPEVEIEDNSEHTPDTELLTETMASIYIKQGKYKKALDVMDKMKETNSKKNRYFSDQERFLKMLVMAKSKSE